MLLSIYPSINLSILESYIYIFLSIHVATRPSINLLLHPSLPPSIYRRDGSPKPPLSYTDAFSQRTSSIFFFTLGDRTVALLDYSHNLPRANNSCSPSAYQKRLNITNAFLRTAIRWPSLAQALVRMSELLFSLELLLPWAKSFLRHCSFIYILVPWAAPLLQFLQPNFSLRAASTKRFASSRCNPACKRVARRSCYNAFKNFQLHFPHSSSVAASLLLSCAQPCQYVWSQTSANLHSRNVATTRPTFAQRWLWGRFVFCNS